VKAEKDHGVRPAGFSHASAKDTKSSVRKRERKNVPGLAVGRDKPAFWHHRFPMQPIPERKK
jgi:hypothetical protein